jgi:hypothetical protein
MSIASHAKALSLLLLLLQVVAVAMSRRMWAMWAAACSQQQWLARCLRHPPPLQCWRPSGQSRGREAACWSSKTTQVGAAGGSSCSKSVMCVLCIPPGSSCQHYTQQEAVTGTAYCCTAPAACLNAPQVLHQPASLLICITIRERVLTCGQHM